MRTAFYFGWRRNAALNGFALVETERADQLRFDETPWHPIPEIGTAANGLVLKYQDTPNYYSFNLGLPLADHRLLKWREWDTALGKESAPTTKERIFGNRRRSRASFNPQLADHERVYQSAKGKNFRLGSTPVGESFKFSQQLISAVTLTNLVYPLYTQRNYIRHYSTGPKLGLSLYLGHRVYRPGFVGN